MPADSYSKSIFKDLDGWRSRFLALVEEGADRLQLSDAQGLPKWLQGAGTDEWERGNRWVLQLAMSSGAPKVSLIAVWDENAIGDAKGGTAHMVQIARAAGTVDVEVIKLKDTVRSSPRAPKSRRRRTQELSLSEIRSDHIDGGVRRELALEPLNRGGPRTASNRTVRASSAIAAGSTRWFMRHQTATFGQSGGMAWPTGHQATGPPMATFLFASGPLLRIS
jgi:hypothetical protein